MVDRDTGELRKEHDRLLVLGGELGGAVLVGQVEVSVRLLADQERHPKERAHRGVADGETVGAGMAVDIHRPQRHRVRDQLPEQAAPPGQGPDLAPRGLVDAQREEPRQLAAGLIEHPERRMPRAGQLPARLEHSLEHHI
jgi:hypothetical protein